MTVDALVCIGDGGVVEVAADDGRVSGIALYDSINAVGLYASVGGRFAELVEEHFRAALDGFAVGVDDGVGVFVLLFPAEVIAFQVPVDDEDAVAKAVYPAGKAMIGASGEVDVYGVAEDRESRQDGYVACLQGVIGCGVNPFVVVVKEVFVQFLYADNVSVGSIDELDEFCLLLFCPQVIDVVGDDGDAAVGRFSVVVADVQRAIVEDVAAYEERTCNGNPDETRLEEQPEDDEEDVDEKEDGECKRQERESREDVGRDECECDAQPHQKDGADVGAEKDADGEALEEFYHETLWGVRGFKVIFL